MSKPNSHEKISRKLTYLLRHGAFTEQIPYDAHGGVSINYLLEIPKFNNVEKESIYKVVENCKKHRFKIYFDSDNIERICATQGHSFKVTPYLSTIITLDNYKDLNINPETIVHGTYRKYLDIIKLKGLSKMGRTHIHFGIDVPESKEVISGMRNSCEVIIFVDILEAIKDGYTFILSNNRVILNEDGIISPKYFKKIVNRK